MRLFIAIPVSDEAKEFLSGLGLDARMVRDFHLTLKFMGDVSENESEKIINALNEIKIQPFRFALSGIGFFPSDRRIRVVWIGAEPKDDIINLQKKIDDKLHALGYGKEKRFHPHITIARVKQMDDMERFIKTARAINIEPIEISVVGFELIKSTLTPAGPVYETVKKFINDGRKP